MGAQRSIVGCTYVTIAIDLPPLMLTGQILSLCKKELFLEFDWRHVSDSRVHALPVVEDVHVVVDGIGCLLEVFEE